ncbi:unnamed protein product [Allacma fusca]|uniref:HAT C-terminal dimerisation domain-containing protein n=1 Tax=Allacma fusca TaxID=39272 RepID=A0A8J2JWZ3_9HEXA|nr:unnamed protein product [Allacma fusca]
MSLSAASYVDLYDHLESYTDETKCHSAILSAAKKACEKLNDYYPKSDGLVYVVGIVLDPRCKLDWHKSVGYKNMVPSYKALVTKCWRSFYKSTEESPKDDDVVLDVFERQMKRAKYDSRDELEKYLSDGPVKSSDLPNGVLSWWKDHENIYPNLSKMARDFLGVSATGVPVECLFYEPTNFIKFGVMKPLLTQNS